ncbi:MAG: membrane protein [Candidatus Syntrophoarchaeum caldarius]|uniref:Membrane protein n=1 Tax=Candidatus Syntropharchaeum caldarium TaxID=1838285 RepID=A0A1F2PD77_9EURY|nr:MAG: membrane protein [Candidatus Syntrophoarchaeum caldarius]
MKEDIKAILKLWGIIYPFAMAVILYITFLMIFFAEEKAAVITVNEYGEGVAEFLTIPIALVFAGLGQILLIKEAYPRK